MSNYVSLATAPDERAEASVYLRPHQVPDADTCSVTATVITLEGNGDAQTVEVSVEASNDLVNWKDLGIVATTTEIGTATGSLANIAFANMRLKVTLTNGSVPEETPGLAVLTLAITFSTQ
jgi:hypothetical protein